MNDDAFFGFPEEIKMKIKLRERQENKN